MNSRLVQVNRLPSSSTPDFKAQYSVRMGGIVLISSDARVPMIYMVETIPSHVRVNAGEYVSLVQATYKGER